MRISILVWDRYIKLWCYFMFWWQFISNYTQANICGIVALTLSFVEKEIFIITSLWRYKWPQGRNIFVWWSPDFAPCQISYLLTLCFQTRRFFKYFHKQIYIRWTIPPSDFILKSLTIMWQLGEDKYFTNTSQGRYKLWPQGHLNTFVWRSPVCFPYIISLNHDIYFKYLNIFINKSIELMTNGRASASYDHWAGPVMMTGRGQLWWLGHYFSDYFRQYPDVAPWQIYKLWYRNSSYVYFQTFITAKKQKQLWLQKHYVNNVIWW